MFMMDHTYSNEISVQSRRKIRIERMHHGLFLSSTNGFERETPFRQSISEKRRLNQQPNKQAVNWKQQSFHDDRTFADRSKLSMSIIHSYK
jgi:hypothetical protein